MTLKIGWFSTGRDPAARNLLKTVHDYIAQEHLPAEISWVFCHRETGDGPFNEEYKQREMFFDLAAGFDIPVATLSHVKFLPDLRKRASLRAHQPKKRPRPYRNGVTNSGGKSSGL